MKVGYSPPGKKKTGFACAVNGVEVEGAIYFLLWGVGVREGSGWCDDRGTRGGGDGDNTDVRGRVLGGVPPKVG